MGPAAGSFGFSRFGQSHPSTPASLMFFPDFEIFEKSQMREVLLIRWNTLMSEIFNFKSAKKMKADLDETVENLNKGIQVEVFTKSPVQKPEVPVPTQAEMAKFYLDLSKCKTKPVLLSLVPPYADYYVLPSRKISTVMDLFDLFVLMRRT